MARELRFSGYSDDTFGAEGNGGDDYDNCASGKPIVWRVASEVTGESLQVWGQFAPKETDGNWVIGICTDDAGRDDKPTPPWPMRFEPNADTPYSPLLIIEVPDDAVMTRRFPVPEDASHAH